jgi:hypothetical protein
MKYYQTTKFTDGLPQGTLLCESPYDESVILVPREDSMVRVDKRSLLENGLIEEVEVKIKAIGE